MDSPASRFRSSMRRSMAGIPSRQDCAGCRREKPTRHSRRYPVCWSQRPNTMAGHGRARLYRVPQQLHLPEQPQRDAGQTCHDVWFPIAAHGRQRARADLRQPRDVRVQQRPDGGLQRRGPADDRDGARVRELPPRRSECDQCRRRSGSRDERPLLHLCVLGAGRCEAAPEPDVEPRPALRHPEAVYRGLRSLVIHEPRPAQSRGRRVSGSGRSSQGTGPNSCNCRTPIETHHGAIGLRLGVAYSLNEAHRCRCLVRN